MALLHVGALLLLLDDILNTRLSVSNFVIETILIGDLLSFTVLKLNLCGCNDFPRRDGREELLKREDRRCPSG
jgi:hypothetical protein